MEGRCSCSIGYRGRLEPANCDLSLIACFGLCWYLHAPREVLMRNSTMWLVICAAQCLFPLFGPCERATALGAKRLGPRPGAPCISKKLQGNQNRASLRRAHVRL